MSKRASRAESAILERYRVALENVEAQAEIATIMSEFGYDATLIEVGKQLFTKTRQAYDLNVKEDDETSEAYSNYKAKMKQMEDTYSLHRKKAKVIFRKDLQIMKRLVLDGSVPKSYVRWLEIVKKFYAEMQSDTELQTKIARLKVTADDLNATSALLTELESARAEYLKEKGESQDATEQKDSTFANLDDWMSEFYAVARIALEDNIQLLESLGVIVRN
ncbi:MAG: hypothetical protein JEY96_16665 [Bacteroidales bacterium]|nr:hypothetical protein [Bacteroidales bacterium]